LRPLSASGLPFKKGGVPFKGGCPSGGAALQEGLPFRGGLSFKGGCPSRGAAFQGGAALQGGLPVLRVGALSLEAKSCGIE